MIDAMRQVVVPYFADTSESNRKTARRKQPEEDPVAAILATQTTRSNGYNRAADDYRTLLSPLRPQQRRHAAAAKPERRVEQHPNAAGPGGAARDGNPASGARTEEPAPRSDRSRPAGHKPGTGISKPAQPGHRPARITPSPTTPGSGRLEHLRIGREGDTLRISRWVIAVD